LTGLALIAAVWGMTRLTVETRFIDYFQEDTEIYQGMLQIDRKLGGTTPLDIVIDAPEEQADNTPRATQQDSGDAAQSVDGFEAVEADPFADDGGGAGANGDDGFGAVEDDPFASSGDDGFGEPAGDDPFADSGTAGQARASDGPNLKGAYWYTPQRLDRIIEMERYLESLPETGKVLSIATTYEVA
ncbi:MAG TPA: transporter, partial [Alcanivorax sp.]|nr:transporter [Alcanivorax sp.]